MTEYTMQKFKLYIYYPLFIHTYCIYFIMLTKMQYSLFSWVMCCNSILLRQRTASNYIYFVPWKLTPLSLSSFPSFFMFLNAVLTYGMWSVKITQTYKDLRLQMETGAENFWLLKSLIFKLHFHMCRNSSATPF